jgi:hypothetical protein
VWPASHAITSGGARDGPALRLDHGGLEPGQLPVLGLADDVHVLLGLVADPVDLDVGQLLAQGLGQPVKGPARRVSLPVRRVRGTLGEGERPPWVNGIPPRLPPK